MNAPALAAAAGLPTWMQTYSGRAFDLLNPDSEAICIEDIAHHLSLINRYTGASRKGISVAQHCVRVGMLLPPYLRLAGLLHDAAEAYTGDWSSPLKVAMRLKAPGFLEAVEAPIEAAIERRFGLTWLNDTDRAEIKRADLIMLATERRDQLAESPRDDWAASSGHPLHEASSDERFAMRSPWSAVDAEFNFLVRFSDWGGKP
jgi:hypothetical protein